MIWVCDAQATVTPALRWWPAARAWPVSALRYRGTRRSTAWSGSSPGPSAARSRYSHTKRYMAAPLLSLCPLPAGVQGPHSLAYGKGGADRQCAHPPSLLDSCNDDSVIQVAYQACPDIQGSESKGNPSRNNCFLFSHNINPLKNELKNNWSLSECLGRFRV